MFVSGATSLVLLGVLQKNDDDEFRYVSRSSPWKFAHQSQQKSFQAFRLASLFPVAGVLCPQAPEEMEVNNWKKKRDGPLAFTLSMSFRCFRMLETISMIRRVYDERFTSFFCLSSSFALIRSKKIETTSEIFRENDVPIDYIIHPSFEFLRQFLSYADAIP